MMPGLLPHSWKEEFALAAAMRQQDILHREKMLRFEARERELTQERRIAEKRREQEATAIARAFASPAQIAEFRTQLDSFDTKTVEALMDNQQAMEAVRRRLDDMLAKAHVLPDGRRVFKTIDGQRVFDEHGQEVTQDTIDPALIDDRRPRWEDVMNASAEWNRLNEERRQLLDYQAKLDEARARLAKGEITEQDLTDLKADLAATMPNAVREKLGLEKPKNDAVEKPNTAPAAALPPDMDSLMRQTGLGPAAPAPAPA